MTLKILGFSLIGSDSFKLETKFANRCNSSSLELDLEGKLKICSILMLNSYSLQSKCAICRVVFGVHFLKKGVK